jgi:hypothetical protein
LADIDDVQDWITTSGLAARASAIATSSSRVSSSSVSAQNSDKPLVHQRISWPRSATQ